ncbi:MAG TPA: peptidylprolyl isomerase [Planctomycetota bacterium]|jgi:hypothetical protein|nr:peptidylprolyl isomerase [Planctomycetota bacterium]
MKVPATLGSALGFLSAASAWFAAGCSASPQKEFLPERSAPLTDRRSKSDDIIAFYNGEPLSWQVVAEKTLELRLKESVDQYVRWRIVEDRKAALAIVHTPRELHLRATGYLEQGRRQLGAAGFQLQLDREGVTAEAKLAQIEKSAFLSQLLALDKIVRFSEVVEDRFEIDRAYFADEAEARIFHERTRAKGFDDAARELVPERKPNRGRLPRESFTQSRPPLNPVLDPWIIEELGRLGPGEVTGVETSQSNLYYVIRLQGFRKGRDVVYSQVKDEVSESVLKDPPTQQDYARWMERELGRCKVDYAEGASRREK